MTDGSQAPVEQTLFDYENPLVQETETKITVDGFHKLKEAMWHALAGNDAACYEELLNMTEDDVKACYRGMNVLLAQVVARGAVHEFRKGLTENQLWVDALRKEDNTESNNKEEQEVKEKE